MQTMLRLAAVMLFLVGGACDVPATQELPDGGTAPRRSRCPTPEDIQTMTQLFNNGAFVEIADDDVFGDGSDHGMEGRPGADEIGDDFLYRAQRDAEARVGENGMPVDDLEHMVRTRTEEQSGQIAMAPFTRINPRTAQNALLGGHALVAPGQPPVEVARWEGDPEEACPVTITWAPYSAPQTNFTNTLRPYVLIEWGTRDGKFSAEIDAGYGGQVTVNANTVFVRVALDAGSTVAYELSATIGFYAASKSKPVYRTRYVTAPASVVRPNFAQNLYALERDVYADTFTLNFDGVGASYTRTVAASTPINPPIALSSDIVEIDITPGGGNAGTQQCLIFELNL